MFRSASPTRERLGLLLVLPFAWGLHSGAPAAARAEETTAPIRHPDAHDPPPDALLAAIPFEEDSEATRIMINLAPEGNKPFVMLLDTGAAASMMTAEMAKEMGISIRRLKRDEYRRRTRLGRDLLFWIDTGSSDSASRSGWSVGLLGSKFLAHYVLELDYPGRVVRFYDRKKYQIPKEVTAPNERVVKLKGGGTRLFAEVEIDGKAVYTLLDTGAPDTVGLSGRAAKKVGIDVDSLEVFGKIGTLYGETEARLYETEDFKFAGFEFPLTPIVVMPAGTFNAGGSTDSAIGYDILRHFLIRIDYKKMRMWLRRAPETPMTLFGRDYASTRGEYGMGLTAATREKLREDTARRERETAERFKEQSASRLFAETPGGGWMRVEGARLEAGRKEGEVWYSFEDMQRIKADRKASQPGTPEVSADAETKPDR